MISGTRDHALSLACVRRGLPSAHGRGFDQLPDEVKARFEEALIHGRSAEELLRALRVVVAGLVVEVEAAVPELAERLNPAFHELTR